MPTVKSVRQRGTRKWPYVPMENVCPWFYEIRSAQLYRSVQMHTQCDAQIRPVLRLRVVVAMP
eukprot:8626818-Prorocentrum_lima.AAC.1